MEEVWMRYGRKYQFIYKKKLVYIIFFIYVFSSFIKVLVVARLHCRLIPRHIHHETYKQHDQHHQTHHRQNCHTRSNARISGFDVFFSFLILIPVQTSDFRLFSVQPCFSTETATANRSFSRIS